MGEEKKKKKGVPWEPERYRGAHSLKQGPLSSPMKWDSREANQSARLYQIVLRVFELSVRCSLGNLKMIRNCVLHFWDSGGCQCDSGVFPLLVACTAWRGTNRVEGCHRGDGADGARRRVEVNDRLGAGIKLHSAEETASTRRLNKMEGKKKKKKTGFWIGILKNRAKSL